MSKKIIDAIESLEAFLDLAITFEKEAISFYKNACTRTSDYQKKEFFSFIQSEEEQHLETYKKLAAELAYTPYSSNELYGEYGNYIKTLVSDLCEQLKIDDSMPLETIIDNAISFEKTKAELYKDVAKKFSDDTSSKIIAIEEEELKHIDELIKFKNNA